MLTETNYGLGRRSDRVGQLGPDLEGAGLMALGLEHAGAAFEHAVEFVDEHGRGLVALVGRNGGVQIRAVDLDMTFGGKTVGDGLFGVALQLHADSHNAILMTKQSLGFFLDEQFEGFGQFEVNT